MPAASYPKRDGRVFDTVVGGTMRAPHIAFYSSVYLPRSENFLYHQLNGLRGLTTSVVAVRAANLSEFPTSSLFLAQPARGSVAWMLDGVWRRVRRDIGAMYRLPRTFAQRLSRHLEATSPDLLYCLFGWHACQLLSVLEELPVRVPLVFHGAGTDVTAAESFGRSYVERLRQAFDRADLILCGSQFLRLRLLDLGAPQHKVRVHYIGVDLPLQTPAPTGRSSASHRFTILAVSRIVPVKGVSLTIRAFAAVAAQMPDAVLEIIGDGPSRGECELLARQLGVGGRVVFRGELPQSVVFEAMRRAHVFVQHNVRSPEGQEEGLGGTIIEAAAHCLPVIVTRSGGIPEAVEHASSGYVVAPGDVAAMASALVELYRSPALREQFGGAGRELVRSRFDRRRQNEELRRMLIDVAASA